MLIKATSQNSSRTETRPRHRRDLRVGLRLAYYWRRLMRVRATPHEVALGCAAGIASFTPFLGFQMLLAGGLAYVLRVSIPAALLGTFAGNPLSWPAIWATSYLAGAWLLGHEPVLLSSDQVNTSMTLLLRAATDHSPVAFEAAADFVTPIIKPMIYGSVLIGLIAAAGSYYPTRRAVRVFQKRRRPV